MADNTVLNAGAGGDTIATDDVAGIKYQYVKLTDGTPDSSTPIPGGADGLLVNLGANNDVVVSNTVNVDASGSAVDATGSIVAVGSSALPAGAATSANQLPDGHNVTVDNGAAGAAVNIQDGGNSITVDNAILSVVGNGAAATAQRVTLANDSTGVIATVSTLTNQSQMGGQAIAMGTGARSAGTQRVTIATDDQVRILGNAGAAFDGATGAAVPANTILNGLRAATANPSNATGGNSVAAMGDKAGRAVVTPGNTRENVAPQTTTITNSTTETTVVTAGGANVFRDISSIAITNRSGTAVSCTLKDSTGGTTRAIYSIAANGGIVIPFPIPMPQSAANANWTITLSINTVTVDVNVVYVNNL